MTIRAFYLRNFILLSILLLSIADFSTDVFSATPATDSPGGGNLIWAKRVGGTNGEYGFGITSLSDNSTVLTGQFKNPATFGEGETNQTILTSGYQFIAKHNPDGTLEWIKSAEGHWEDITTLSDDSTVVIGQFWSSATFGEDEPNETVLTSAGG